MNAKNLNVLLGIAVVVLLGVVGYLTFMDKPQEQTLSQQNNNSTPANNKPVQPANNSNVSLNTDSNTATWKTYADTQNGFEFMYPKNFNKIDAPQLVTFARDNNDGINGDAITIAILSKKLDPNNIQGVYGKIENPQKVPLGSKIGYKYSQGDAGCIAWVVVTDLGSNKTLELGFGTCEDDLHPRLSDSLYYNEKQVAQILSTFKFTK